MPFNIFWLLSYLRGADYFIKLSNLVKNGIFGSGWVLKSGC